MTNGENLTPFVLPLLTLRLGEICLIRPYMVNPLFLCPYCPKMSVKISTPANLEVLEMYTNYNKTDHNKTNDTIVHLLCVSYPQTILYKSSQGRCSSVYERRWVSVSEGSPHCNRQVWPEKMTQIHNIRRIYIAHLKWCLGMYFDIHLFMLSTSKSKHL